MQCIVSHFKRASNHNSFRFSPTRASIVSHFKRASNHNTSNEWHEWAEHCFSFQKSIKSQLISLLARSSFILFLISKEHQITTAPTSCGTSANCFSFQKSIKSQRAFVIVDALAILFLISKEHQITTPARSRLTIAALFLISKEHQITTRRCLWKSSPNCFSFQKSIKSQHVPIYAAPLQNCVSFQKSIKSQQRH